MQLKIIYSLAIFCPRKHHKGPWAYRLSLDINFWDPHFLPSPSQALQHCLMFFVPIREPTLKPSHTIIRFIKQLENLSTSLSNNQGCHVDIKFHRYLTKTSDPSLISKHHWHPYELALGLSSITQKLYRLRFFFLHWHQFLAFHLLEDFGLWLFLRRNFVFGDRQ
jgi:hypothetical protein